MMSPGRAIDEVDEGWDEFLKDDESVAAPTSNGACAFLQQTGIEHYLWWDRDKDVGVSPAEYLEIFRSFGATKEEVSSSITDHIASCTACAKAYESAQDYYDRLDRNLRRSSFG